MADSILGKELSCFICREIYTDPVTLPCGHNFCRGCIGATWDGQKSKKLDLSCPQCKQRYNTKPELKRNLRLRNIAERFRSTHPEHHVTGIFGYRTCSTHNEPLKYHCCKDGAPICASCCLFGDHWGHRVELLSEASEKKKEKLRKVLEKLSPEREETERGAQRLQERRRELEEKAAIETERVTALFRGIREELEALEKRLLSDISRQKEELTLTLTELIQQLEIKKDELSREIRHIEELCNMADPLTVLQEQWESHGAAFCGAEGADTEGADTEGREREGTEGADTEGREREDIKDPAVGDLDVGRISETLLTGLAGIVTGVKGRIYGQDMLAPGNPAGNNTVGKVAPSISQPAGKQNISPAGSAPDCRSDPVYGQEATDLVLDINTAGNTSKIPSKTRIVNVSHTAQSRSNVVTAVKGSVMTKKQLPNSDAKEEHVFKDIFAPLKECPSNAWTKTHAPIPLPKLAHKQRNFTVFSKNRSYFVCGPDKLALGNPAGNNTVGKVAPSISQLAGKQNISQAGSAPDSRSDPVYGQEATELEMERNTAGGRVSASWNKKSASYKFYPQTPGRFRDYTQF